MNKHTKKYKKNKKSINKIATVMSMLSIVISICSLYFAKTDNRRNEMLLQPRFTIAKNESSNGEIIWKLVNSGGTISNADIYPIMYVDLAFCDTEAETIDEVSSSVRLYLADYFSDNNYQYDANNNTFYVNDYRQNDLQAFASEFIGMRSYDGVECVGYSSQICFVINYDNYEGKKFNKVFGVTDYLLTDNPGDVISYRENQLYEIKEIPSYDMRAPMDCEGTCVIEANYEQAEVQQQLDSWKKYKAYLYYIAMDLAKDKGKPVEEIIGTLILTSDGQVIYKDFEFWNVFQLRTMPDEETLNEINGTASEILLFDPETYTQVDDEMMTSDTGENVS